MGWTIHPDIVITQENYKQEQNIFSTLVFYMQKDKQYGSDPTLCI